MSGRGSELSLSSGPQIDAAGSNRRAKTSQLESKLLRPDDPDPIGAVHSDLGKPTVAAGPRNPMQVLPDPVLVVADGDIVSTSVETEPGHPDGAVRRRRDGRHVVLAKLVTHRDRRAWVRLGQRLRKGGASRIHQEQEWKTQEKYRSAETLRKHPSSAFRREGRVPNPVFMVQASRPVNGDGKTSGARSWRATPGAGVFNSREWGIPTPIRTRGTRFGGTGKSPLRPACTSEEIGE